jgi:hypothetical protein
MSQQRRCQAVRQIAFVAGEWWNDTDRGKTETLVDKTVLVPLCQPKKLSLIQRPTSAETTVIFAIKRTSYFSYFLVVIH